MISDLYLVGLIAQRLPKISKDPSFSEHEELKEGKEAISETEATDYPKVCYASRKCTNDCICQFCYHVNEALLKMYCVVRMIVFVSFVIM